MEKFRCAANRFWRFCDFDIDNFTKDYLQSFLGQLKREISPKTGLFRSASTISYYRNVLRVWFDVLGIDWPLTTRRIHQPTEDRRAKVPSFTYKETVSIIRLVKKYGSEEEKYYFALSTVYFPRRQELGYKITPDSFHWNGDDTGVLEFEPIKHGLTRRHLIPKELTPYIKPYSEKVKPVSPWMMSRKFHSFCHHIGFRLPKTAPGQRGYGWHAPRHTVETELRNHGVDRGRLNRWAGWRTGSTMADYYDMPDLMELDKKITVKHPFIKIWAEK